MRLKTKTSKTKKLLAIRQTMFDTDFVMKNQVLQKAIQTFEALPMDKLREGTPKPTRDEAIQAIAGCINSRIAWIALGPSQVPSG
jgi:hypothetical protein